MSTRWIVTALGKDRPGIVAGITKILYQLGCNLEDSAMTRLGGEFAVMLAFSASAKAGADRLRRAFEPLEKRLHCGLERFVRKVVACYVGGASETASDAAASIW